MNGWTLGPSYDVTGLHVSPGFIDTHSHAGPGPESEERGHGEPLPARGLATVVINPDGGGPVDLAGRRTGPFHPPGSFAENAELIGLARVAAEFGGIYTSHVRDESNHAIGVPAAVEEVIDASRQTRITGRWRGRPAPVDKSTGTHSGTTPYRRSTSSAASIGRASRVPRRLLTVTALKMEL